MKWYCEKCKTLHDDEEMCPRIKAQLKEQPQLLSQAADFVTVAGENALISSNALNTVVQGVNRLAGTNLTYEGTKQFARDIQVFRRLDQEPFKISGVFSSPENAKKYFEAVQEISKTSPKAMQAFEAKLTGYAQEVDWLRMKQGQASSLFQKSQLLSGNAPGIDGTTINRFTGKTISRTSIKASKNPVNSSSTVVKNLQESIAQGHMTENDIIFGSEGMKQAVKDAGLNNPVIEKNSAEQVRRSNQRLKDKIMKGQATTSATMSQVGQKMTQGSIVGAAVGLTVSSITNYIRYRNGEKTREEAFSDIGQDTLKSALIGGATGAVTIFLPGGVIGYTAGIAVGIYIETVCGNILDEIYGKGASGAILKASGYVYGMTTNLSTCLKRIEGNVKRTQEHIHSIREGQKETKDILNSFEQLKESF